MAIKAITFDLDDTLWPVAPVIERAEQCVHAWLQSHHPRLAARYGIEDLRALRLAIAAEQPARAHDLAYLREESVRRAALACGEPAHAGAGAYAVFDAARHEVAFFADVLPTLERLSRRYRLGVLSNGTACVVRLGLEPLFSFALSASAVGRAKPDAAMFVQAEALLQAHAQELVHVGDHHEHDIAGAARAGWRTVWINRNHQPWPGGPPPDAEIASLAELEAVLTAWG